MVPKVGLEPTSIFQLKLMINQRGLNQDSISILRHIGGRGGSRTHGVSDVTDLQSAALATKHTLPY